MATTYELIAQIALSSSPESIALDNIPATYDDLALVCSMRSTRTGTSWVSPSITFNSANNWTDYSGKYLRGDGSSVTSNTAVLTNYYGVFLGNAPTAGHTANTYSNVEVYIPNYAGSSNKSLSVTSCGETNNTNALMQATAGLWSSTAAITKITVWCNAGIGGHAFASGSSFYLYGIKRSS